ncbi:hypothetical protein ACSBR1_016619 [Camellia fascicularis]
MGSIQGQPLLSMKVIMLWLRLPTLLPGTQLSIGEFLFSFYKLMHVSFFLFFLFLLRFLYPLFLP